MREECLRLETDLTKERARLDWAMNNSYLVMPAAQGFAAPLQYQVVVYHCGGNMRFETRFYETPRQAIDDAMAEDAKWTQPNFSR